MYTTVIIGCYSNNTPIEVTDGYVQHIVNKFGIINVKRRTVTGPNGLFISIDGDIETNKLTEYRIYSFEYWFGLIDGIKKV